MVRLINSMITASTAPPARLYSLKMMLYVWRESTSVACPGPPPVSGNIMSKVLRVEIVIRMTLIMSIGLSCGMVMFQGLKRVRAVHLGRLVELVGDRLQSRVLQDHAEGCPPPDVGDYDRHQG